MEPWKVIRHRGQYALLNPWGRIVAYASEQSSDPEADLRSIVELIEMDCLRKERDPQEEESRLG